MTQTSDGPWRPTNRLSPLIREKLDRDSLTYRIEKGRSRRDAFPRNIHAHWKPNHDRPNPVDTLEAEGVTRQPDLLPVRYSRLAESPFHFFRGAASIMASDLAGTPATGIQVQLCGDCHLNNFGVYASPDRELVFDINDFDETMPGPWEWDVQRLAASFVIGSRVSGFSEATGLDAATATAAAYRNKMNEFSQMTNLEVWHTHIKEDDLLKTQTNKAMRKRTVARLNKARSKDHLKALAKLTQTIDGHTQFKSDPPVLVRLETDDLLDRMHSIFLQYGKTMRQERRALLDQYQPVDIARKVVGVGSVGTRCAVILLEGRDSHDPLFIQVKEAEPSALEKYLPKHGFKNHGERVVRGQRLMQTVSDIFLGWIRGAIGVDFYFRQLQDMKGSLDLATASPEGVMIYARVCGWTLARAHARTGDRIQIASYLGKGDKFDRAMSDFAKTYADQNERDYETFMAAIKSGRLEVREA